MSPDQLAALNENVSYIRDRVDDIQKEQSDLRVSVEHRLTKVEVKSSIIASITGLIGGLLGTVGLHLKGR